MLREVNGLKWVADDVECAAVLFDQVKNIATDVIAVRDGFLGVRSGWWQLRFVSVGACEVFRSSCITAEPDPANYDALEGQHRGVVNIVIHDCAFGCGGWLGQHGD